MNQETIQKTQEPKLIRVDAPTLYAHWPWLERKLSRMKKKDQSGERWTPAHVREGVLKGITGQSTVELYFSVEADGEISGFMVTYVKIDNFIGLPCALFVWFLYANDGLIQRFLPALEEMARRRYLRQVEFCSTRRGWLRLAGKGGFEPGPITYRKAVL
jgi:GNAT superfamily N-acetyltransferase